MEITLPPDLEKFIETQVSSGKYASADAVVLASIQLLAQQEVNSQRYVPKTSLGQRLQSIRQRSVAAGMSLVPAEAIAEDIRSQRDRLHNRHEDLA